MERDCESELSKLNTEQNACIYHFGASVIHGQRSNILRLPNSYIPVFINMGDNKGNNVFFPNSTVIIAAMSNSIDTQF